MNYQVIPSPNLDTYQSSKSTKVLIQFNPNFESNPNMQQGTNPELKVYYEQEGPTFLRC